MSEIRMRAVHPACTVSAEEAHRLALGVLDAVRAMRSAFNERHPSWIRSEDGTWYVVIMAADRFDDWRRAAARLETYDVLQARLTACEPTFAPDAEASETAHAAEEAAIAAAQSILRKAIAMNGQRPTERDRALLGSRNLTVRAFSRALFSHGFEPTFWFRTSGLAIEEASRP